VAIAVGLLPGDALDAQLGPVDGGEQVEQALVALADRLATLRALPASHLLVAARVDGVGARPRESGPHLGRVQGEDGVEVPRLQEGWQVAVELGGERSADGVARRLPV